MAKKNRYKKKKKTNKERPPLTIWAILCMVMGLGFAGFGVYGATVNGNLGALYLVLLGGLFFGAVAINHWK